MTDQQIIALYCRRSEQAIAETAAQYGKLFFSVSYNILRSNEDAEECVNDTYLTAWNIIPPTKPTHLSTFLCKITRSLSIAKWRSKTAQKRGGNHMTLAIHELDHTLASDENLEEHFTREELTQTIARFLRSLPDQERRVFICRYWYMDSISTIAGNFGYSQSKVKTMLLRTRKKLKAHFEQEGGWIE